jgi:YfiH family protein
MFKFAQKGMVRYLESEALTACDFLTHAFLTRWDGVSEGTFSSLNFSIREGDEEDRVARNWEILGGAFQISPSQFFMISQIHGDKVFVADSLMDKGPLPLPVQCDAVITASKRVAIGIKTADCVPILLADRVRRVIGAVHAGWRGTSLNIAAKSIQVMTERFSSRPGDILAAIGPAVGPCCYQVDEKVFSSSKGERDWESSFQRCEEDGRWMLDLPLANRMQMLKMGLPPENISFMGICTSCRTDLFFSHRAEKGVTGRQLNFIVLE